MVEMENPCDAPRHANTDAAPRRFHLAPFRWWHVFGWPFPLAWPFIFNVLYDPIDRNWTVVTFGCGCPNLDGTYRAFTANHFNAILWIFTLAVSGLTWFMFCRAVIRPHPPIEIIIPPILLAAGLCYQYFLGGIWL